MGKIQKSIRELVTIDIFKMWDLKGKIEGSKYARKELKKLYLKFYHKLDNMEDKRLILWNLIVSCGELNDMDSIKIYSEQLKKDMDNTENYKVTDKHWYASMLSAYRDSHINELSKQELIDIDIFCYNAYKRHINPNDKHYIDMLIMKFNLSLSLKQYNMVLEIIETVLHTYKKEYESVLDQFIEDTKKEDINLYNNAQILIKNNKVEAM